MSMQRDRAVDAAAEVLIGTLGITPDSPSFTALATATVRAYLETLDPDGVADALNREWGVDWVQGRSEGEDILDVIAPEANR